LGFNSLVELSVSTVLGFTLTKPWASTQGKRMQLVYLYYWSEITSPAQILTLDKQFRLG
jgi:hypothetical protein